MAAFSYIFNIAALHYCILYTPKVEKEKASFYGDTVVFASHAEGRGFDPQPGQMVFRIFSPMTSILALN